MITNKGGELVATCEECGCEEFGGVLGFREFVADLKQQGWAIRKDQGEWMHTCPDCGGK